MNTLKKVVLIMEQIRACVLAGILVVLAVPAWSQISATKVGRGAYPDIAVDSAGGVHLVYVRDGKLRYRHRDSQSGRWSAEQDTGLAPGTVQRSDPEVVTDSRNWPHVLVGSSYAHLEGGRWRAIEPGIVRDTALAIDSRNRVYIVRRGGHGGGHVGLLVCEPGGSSFQPLPDPDVAGGLPLGRNDHVYGHVFGNPRDDSIHIVYHHGAPRHFAYRVSTDGGRTWASAGISDDDKEAPSGAVSGDGAVYVVSGTGEVFRRGGKPDEWTSLGRAVDAAGRDLPVIAVDAAGRVHVAGFKGRVNVHAGGKWLGQTTLPSLARKPMGFVDLAVSTDRQKVYAVWEEGEAVQNYEPAAGELDLLFAVLDPAELQASAKRAPQSERGQPRVARRVGQWNRFEGVAVSEKKYGDPYNDVTLNVTYTRPDGSAVKFWGFYDNGDRWKFRFMPDQVGSWKYEASFSDGTPGPKGSFQCVVSDLPGKIGRDETNPMWFGFEGGKRTLIRALHIGDRFFAANWSDEQRTAFLDWAGSQGYNTLSIASHFLKREAPDRGGDWDLPKLWPLDAAEYQQMERIFDELARRRIVVFPFAGFFGQKSNYPTDPAGQECYIRYTLARLGSYWNLMWNVAGPEPNLAKSWMSSEDVERLGRLIARLDPLDHLISVHNRSGNDPYRDSDWTTYGVLQGPKTNDLNRLSRGLLESHHPGKPLLAQETLWSGNVNHMKGRDYTDDELRRNAWVIHMSAAALVFADNGGGHSSAGFSGSLNPAEAEQHRHDIVRQVWDLVEEFPFHRLTPHQDLVDRGYCLAEPGEHYLVYLPSPGAVNVKIEGGPFTVKWIAARTGERRNGGTTKDGAGLKSPSDGHEWLLEMVRLRESRSKT